jgi:hypothetical protein
MVKNNKIKRFKIAMSLVLIVFFMCIKTNAQRAENLFVKHQKWGIITQYNLFEGAKVSPTNNINLNYQIPESKLFALGIVYNFYQKKHWNFKTELQLQWFTDYDELLIAEPENVTSSNIVFYGSTTHDKTGYLPVTIEYMFFETGSFSFGVGAGVGLTYYWHYDISGSSGLAINDVTLFEAFQRDDYPLFYFSNHIQASIYFKRKNYMLQASVVYKKNLGDSFKEGRYEFKNLEQSPDVYGTFKQSGDFLGFSLSIYPKKFLNK